MAWRQHWGGLGSWDSLETRWLGGGVAVERQVSG